MQDDIDPKLQCDLCDNSDALQLSAKCHLTAPLKVELVNQKTLILRCYVPDCSREVARFTVQEFHPEFRSPPRES